MVKITLVKWMHESPIQQSTTLEMLLQRNDPNINDITF